MELESHLGGFAFDLLTVECAYGGVENDLDGLGFVDARYHSFDHRRLNLD